MSRAIRTLTFAAIAATLAAAPALAQRAPAPTSSGRTPAEPRIRSLPGWSAAFPCAAPDWAEENDSRAAATLLAPGAARATYGALAACPGDLDVFSVELDAGDVLSVDLDFAHVWGDIDLMVLRPNVMYLAGSNSVDDDELVNVIAPVAGEYLIVVHLYADDAWVEGAAYTLRAAVRSGPHAVAGAVHSCRVDHLGGLTCWGHPGGHAGQPAGLPPIAVASAAGHTCGLTRAGVPSCSGEEDLYGQEPTDDGPYADIAAGAFDTCAITTAGALQCWGASPYSLPPPPTGSRFVQVSVGYQHACALDVDGAVACWGSNADGQAAPDPGTYVQISAGLKHTCAVRVGGGISCWGDNQHGKAADLDGVFVEVSAGSHHTCARHDTGELVCWGHAGDGRLDAPAGTFVSLSAGDSHTCALTATGEPRCWGHDGWAQSDPPPCPGLPVLAAAPATLAATGIGDPAVMAFAPEFALWSDGADKSRWAYLPGCYQVDTSNLDAWQLPTGARLWKEFRKGGAKIETRLITRTGPGDDDWLFATYKWNAAGTQAALLTTGEENVHGSGHDIPAPWQCGACHGSVPGRVLGFSAVQLNAPDSDVTVATLSDAGRLTHPAAGFSVPGSGVEREALGYLHANCGQCHNALGTGVNTAAPADGIPSMNLWVSTGEATVEETGAYQTAIDQPLANFDAALPGLLAAGFVPDYPLPATLSRIAAGDTLASAVFLRMWHRARRQHAVPRDGRARHRRARADPGVDRRPRLTLTRRRYAHDTQLGRDGSGPPSPPRGPFVAPPPSSLTSTFPPCHRRSRPPALRPSSPSGPTPSTPSPTSTPSTPPELTFRRARPSARARPQACPPTAAPSAPAPFRPPPDTPHPRRAPPPSAPVAARPRPNRHRTPYPRAAAASSAARDSSNTRGDKAAKMKKARRDSGAMDSPDVPSKAAVRAAEEKAREVDFAADQVEGALMVNMAKPEFVGGFGNNGGEEYLSYMLVSESLAIKGGEKWSEWDTKVTALVNGVQNEDGSWTGHHCITGRTFCTAAAPLVLMGDRTPVPEAVIATN